MARIVIIGSGLTGLSAAYHLEQRGCFDYQIFEKESTIGGLCRSVTVDGFTFDYTGHLLHASDQYHRESIIELCGLNALHSIHRRSFIYSQQTYTKYPYQINLHGLPNTTIAECLEGYIKRKKIKNPRSYIQWVQTSFGDGFAKHFFFPYQQKIFACPLEDLTASWTNNFVPQTSLAAIIQGIQGNTTDSIGYNAHFFYPKTGGIQHWIHVIAHQLKNPIATRRAVTAIDTKQRLVHFATGDTESYEQLISTMPLPLLLEQLPGHHNRLRDARQKLRCNSVVNLNLGMKRPAEQFEKHWIYLPESNTPLYRIGFPHNFAPANVPAGCSSLYAEFSYINKPRSYIERNIDASRQSIMQLLDITPQDISTEIILEIPYAYVIYDAWRDRNLKNIHRALQKLHIYSAGRYGEWKYSSMQDAWLDGKKIAETVHS